MAERRGDWMITYTGRRFYPMDPDPVSIVVEDIAHHLARICRYGGAVDGYFSVAEHSCHLSDYFQRMGRIPLARGALMHDASEAYLGDVIRPIKPELPAYLEIEANLERVIAAKFGLEFPLPLPVKEADKAIVGDERSQLFSRDALLRAGWEPRKGLGIRLEQWNGRRAEAEFLFRFRALFP